MKGAPHQWEIYAREHNTRWPAAPACLVPSANDADSGCGRCEPLWFARPSPFSGEPILLWRRAANGTASHQNLALGT
jgi:hypothetical protein